MAVETLIRTANGWQSMIDGRTVGVLDMSDPATGILPGWGAPSWSDEFTGSSLNTSVWNIRDGYVEAQDQSIMRTGNVTVSDSCVHLTAKKETTTSGGTTRDYTSGYIDTIGKWSRRYGRFEIRARLPTDPGVSRALWPAIWLRDATGTGEIDILETIGTPNNHPEVYPTGGGYYSSSLYKTTGVKTTGNPYWTQVFQNINTGDGQFHVWGFEWTPTHLYLICDGKRQKTFDVDDWEQFDGGFPSGVNFRIDLFIGSSWQGWADDSGVETVLPRSLSIDYVRYWEMP